MPSPITQRVGGKLVVKTVTLTRPSDTTAYTAGDVVSNTGTSTLLQFGPGLVREAGGDGIIVKARLMTDRAADASVYRLLLFSTNIWASGVTQPPNDNAADILYYADRQHLTGYIDFPALTAGAGSNTGAMGVWTGGIGSATAPGGPLPFVCGSTPYLQGTLTLGDTSLYGKLVCLTPSGSPTSGQNFFLALTVLQN